MISVDDIILIKGAKATFSYNRMMPSWISGDGAAQQSRTRIALKSDATASKAVVKMQMCVVSPATATVSTLNVLRV